MSRQLPSPPVTDFSQHRREVEEYINYQDKPTLYREGLQQRVSGEGFSSLNDNEQVFYALSYFEDALSNLGVRWFFNQVDEEVVEAAQQGFAALGCEELSAGFKEARQAYSGQADCEGLDEETDDDADDRLAVFVDYGDLFEDLLDNFVERHQLF